MTVVATLDGRSRVAVTVLTPPDSGIDAGVSTRVTSGSGSSSAMVTGTPPDGTTERLETVVWPRTSTVSSGSSVSSGSDARAKVPVPSV